MNNKAHPLYFEHKLNSKPLLGACWVLGKEKEFRQFLSSQTYGIDGISLSVSLSHCQISPPHCCYESAIWSVWWQVKWAEHRREKSLPLGVGDVDLGPAHKKRAGLLCLCGPSLLMSPKVQKLFCDSCYANQLSFVCLTKEAIWTEQNNIIFPS